MSDFQLNLKRLIERPERYFPRNEIVSRQDDGSLFRYTYREYCARVRRLASALGRLGLQPGERVATLSWNTHQHLELYFAVPCSGRVLHTANLRLSDEHLAYSMNHAEDVAVFFLARSAGSTRNHRPAAQARTGVRHAGGASAHGFHPQPAVCVRRPNRRR